MSDNLENDQDLATNPTREPENLDQNPSQPENHPSDEPMDDFNQETGEEITGFDDSNQETGEKIAGLGKNRSGRKRPRRRNRGSKKSRPLSPEEGSFGNPEKGSFENVVKWDLVEKSGAGSYTRKELEALRFVDMERQKRKWVEVYCGLGPVVAKEYDGLAESVEDEHWVDFDPRYLVAKTRPVHSIVGGESDITDGGTENMDGDYDLEENNYIDDDSDGELTSIQKPFVVVTGEPDFDSGPPLDGLEFLRRVRWEAEHIPKVKVAKVEKSKLTKEQTVYMPEIPVIAKCPEHLMPSKQWEDAFLADFSELRAALYRQENTDAAMCEEFPVDLLIDEEISPQPLESVVLEKFDTEEITPHLLGSVVLEKIDTLTKMRNDCCSSDGFIENGSSNVDESCTTLPASIPNASSGAFSSELPSLHTILEMESVARVSNLRKRIKSVETVDCLTRNDCAWLFALCAAVDTPLDADTCASLRCLLRKCASLRAAKSELDDEVVMLNILATISGKYFGQLEG